MKPRPSYRRVFQVILSGEYTPLELGDFVKLCHSLTLPFIRRKIALGKINPGILGLSEKDIVTDCIADLFYRDETGAFPQIRTFFQNQDLSIEHSTEEELFIGLRRLVLGKVNNSITRLYSEIDPVLGKILRNVKLALERTQLFEQVTRFGETYLMTRGVDVMLHLSPIPVELVRHELSKVVLIHDPIPMMVRKTYDVLVGQTDFQRSIPLVSAALLFKEIYALGDEPREDEFGHTGEAGDVEHIAEIVCRSMKSDLHPSYVGTGKRSEDVFASYLLALRDILVAEFGNHEAGAVSYFECLKAHIADLTKAAYSEQHRTVLEYLAKTAKQRMKEELRRQ